MSNQNTTPISPERRAGQRAPEVVAVEEHGWRRTFLDGGPVIGNVEDIVKAARDQRLTLICMVGLPYSGKSTHAEQLDCPVVSPDAIRLALHGQRFVAQAEEMVWLHARLMVRALFGAKHPKVVLDACNTSHARRAQWISAEWKTEFHHIITPFDTCLERATRANDVEIMAVIERMNREWQPMSFGCGQAIRLFERGREIDCYPQGWEQIAVEKEQGT